VNAEISQANELHDFHAAKKGSVSASNQPGDKTNHMPSGMRYKIAFQSRETLKVSLMAAKIKSGDINSKDVKKLKS
jgi:hypothetical protein